MPPGVVISCKVYRYGTRSPFLYPGVAMNRRLRRVLLLVAVACLALVFHCLLKPCLPSHGWILHAVERLLHSSEMFECSVGLRR